MSNKTRWNVISAAVIAVASFVLTKVASAQAPATDQGDLAFDVVSIRPHVFIPGPGHGESFSSDPSMLRITALTNRIIDFAYQDPNAFCRPELLSVCNGNFDLIAKTSKPATREQQRIMLRKVLTERFKLKFHIETKEGPVLALVLGPKPKNLNEVEVDGAFGIKVTMSPDSFADDAFLLIGRNVNMTEIAKWMTGGGKPVTDKTGLTGRYDFDLKAPASHQGNMIGLPVEVQNDIVAQHFGLKLQQERGQIETMVIDHIEKPSEN